jgi:uncharacterized delta-60 repeat protein
MRVFIAVCSILVLALICLGQNFSVGLIPLSGLVLPDSGGIISYQVTVTNLEAVPRSADVWGTVTRPNGTIKPAPGQTTETFLGNQSKSWQRQETLPPRAPVGYYTLKAYVGLYPNTIWAQAECQFQKQVLTGGVQQEWVARFNGTGNYDDRARSLVVDGYGNVYVTGHRWGNGMWYNFDYATIKYNTAGIQLWLACYDGDNNLDDAVALDIDESSNVYVTGVSDGNGTNDDFATIKYNVNGVQQWVARYNGPGNAWDGATSLALDGNGNVFVTGPSWGIGTNYDYATIKYDVDGVQQWVARYNGPGNSWDNANILALDHNGNIYITGYSYGSGSGYDYATIKYNVNGVQQWVARYNGPGNNQDIATGLAVDGNGNVYVTGGSAGDYATIKYNTDGDTLWVAHYNGSGNGSDQATFVAVDGEGNVYVTGISVGIGTGNDFATIKYDSAGVQQWIARYNGPGNTWDEAHHIVIDGDGNLYVAGSSFGSGGTESDYTTIKYNADGEEQWLARYNGNASSTDIESDLVVDIDGNVYVTGYSFGVATDKDFATLKYTQPAVPNWQEVTAVPFGAPLPEESRLLPPSPNPFNVTTVASFELRVASHVRLTVWDTAGRLVATLVNGWRQAGEHEVTFDGAGLASGVYFIRMQAGEFTGVQKMMLVK